MRCGNAVFVRVCACACVRTRLCVYVCVRVFVCLCACVFVRACARVRVPMRVRLWAGMSTRACWCVHLCVRTCAGCMRAYSAYLWWNDKLNGVKFTMFSDLTIDFRCNNSLNNSSLLLK